LKTGVIAVSESGSAPGEKRMHLQVGRVRCGSGISKPYSNLGFRSDPASEEPYGVNICAVRVEGAAGEVDPIVLIAAGDLPMAIVRPGKRPGADAVRSHAGRALSMG